MRAYLSEPTTLEAHLNLPALYKTDAHLQAAHVRFYLAVTWDDHKVHNDCAGDQSQDRVLVEDFLRRRASPQQAYYGHMPARRNAKPVGPL